MTRKRWWALAAAVAMVIALVAAAGFHLLPTPGVPAPLDPAQAARATQFLDRLDDGDAAAALTLATAQMRDGLGAEKLGKLWKDLPANLGPRRERHPPRGETLDGHPVVTVGLEFAAVTLDARIVFDGANRVAGFWLVPGSAAAKATVELAAGERFEESAAQVGDLPATLTRPRGTGPFPALVFVHGSGPHDRDERIGPNRPFRDLAHGLAARGIASLRYDKRTKVAPQSFADGDFTIDEETTDDAVAALAALRAMPGIDAQRVFLLGHSQGAMMAPRIAQRGEVAGLVLLAAPARPLQDIYVQQLEFLGAPTLEEERGKAADPAGHRLMGLPTAYWNDLRDYDPVVIAGGLPLPLLVLQGERDYQVTPADDFARWQAAFGNDSRAMLKAYAGLNHLFIAGEGAPSPADYERAGQVAPAVIDDIADWMLAAR